MDIISVFLDFRFSSRKSLSQQKLAKKVTHFTIQFCSKDLTHFTNFGALDIENDMLPKHSQKPFPFYNFSSKKYLHCTISGRPRNAFLKHFESKCLSVFCIFLYISVRKFYLVGGGRG